MNLLHKLQKEVEELKAEVKRLEEKIEFYEGDTGI